ncbi:tyrosine-type recombinase/integrase [Gardnerella vaginalis]|uniref:tyrosine-type recombinase/integrase n=1 Tax=Gardnerella vaginalis TaxID=2702 RepID=UPI00026351D8|nr:site-specific integrase [Gardnerella vaginalis]EIK74738.1 integrase [Gardnerella vaginalis 75712]
MARKSSFGQYKTPTWWKKKKHKPSEHYYDVFYPTPIEAFAKWSHLPKRQCKPHGARTVQEAQDWLKSEEALVRSGQWTPVKVRKARRERNSVLFSDYANSFIENNERLGKSTKNKYFELLNNHLLFFFGDMQVRAITYLNVEKWFNGEPDNTARVNAYKLLSEIMHAAENDVIDDEGNTLIDKSPCRLKNVVRPKKKHETVVPTEKQIGELVSHMPERLRLIELIAYGMGFRIGEILALQRRDIELNDEDNKSVIHVRHSLKDEKDERGKTIVVMGSTKTKSSEGSVPIPDSLKPLFKKQLKEYTSKEADAFIFTTEKNNNFIRPSNFRCRYHNPARKQVEGLEEYWPHDGRHACVINMLENGESVNVVSKQVRHADVRTTAHFYADATTKGALEKANEKISKQLSKVLNSEPTKTASNESVESVESTKPNSNSPNNSEAASGLYAFLVSMEMSARIQALKGMSKEQRKQALNSLPDGMREATKDAFINSIE